MLRITLRRISYKDCELTYVDGAHRLVMSLETAGPPHGGFVALDTAFAEWSAPAGRALNPAERVMVQSRIDAWARAQKIVLRFVPAMTVDEMEATLNPRGWPSVKDIDSAGREMVSYRPPLFSRLKWLVHRVLRRRGR